MTGGGSSLAVAMLGARSATSPSIEANAKFTATRDVFLVEFPLCF
jgi:hypothetical protein